MKFNEEKASSFISYCKVWEGIFQEASGAAGGLGDIWNPMKVRITLLEKAEHWMICSVFSFKEELNFPLINVYGPIKTLEKQETWKTLTKKMMEICNNKVVVVGDFNTLLDLDEKNGGLRMSNKIMEDFREFVMQNHLMNVVPKNGSFTWKNKRAKFTHISERLDRHLIGEAWLKSSFQVEALILPISLSDHRPVELKLSETFNKERSSFKFLSMWWRDPKFLTLLKEWWEDSNIFGGSLSFCFVNRLKVIKEKIKIWNRDSFKNIFVERNRIEEELNQINRITISVGMTNDMYNREVSLKEELAEILHREEVFWRDKSREL
ncbi:hypothetical protein SUGI_0077010 [Cryptomeria japonica]|nr:hypothetical protein SUGI_0077010 [Cryptomeria japonica]